MLRRGPSSRHPVGRCEFARFEIRSTRPIHRHGFGLYWPRVPQQTAPHREDTMIASRTLLKGAAMPAAAAGTTAFSIRPGGAQPVPYSAGTEPPKLKAPP